MKIEQHELKSNGEFSLIREPHIRKKNPNTPGGTEFVVEVLDHETGQNNRMRLYHSPKKGLFFKKRGHQHLSSFTKKVLYVPLQIKEI